MPTLRELRVRAGLSQTALARAAGISRVTLVRIEAGRQEALVRTAARICRVLGVGFQDVEEFRNGGPPAPES